LVAVIALAMTAATTEGGWPRGGQSQCCGPSPVDLSLVRTGRVRLEARQESSPRAVPERQIRVETAPGSIRTPRPPRGPVRL
jgi:hypothetical protein